MKLNQTTKCYIAIHDQDTFYRIDLYRVPKFKVGEIRRSPEDLYRRKTFAMQKTKNLSRCYRVYKENDVLGVELFIKTLKKEPIKDSFLRDFIEKMEKGILEIVSRKSWYGLD